ncbi:Uncharacterized protein BP5553_09964 [Venustampulla echinocandica]|uniref:N-alpha-acetyltransferase 40 n=1 Tax=Venustampulla echinocandica TaxID=2656787 RepID=A0A370TB76_9HELO|nr:Uncharacterized protein BP5553_09964 [Venustampulla echinocandica]RDL31175.1 Uncharacterized protein BP5553_09964 [Venustampulla echinocandica]
MDPIDVANSKGLSEFIQEYLPSSEEWSLWVHPANKTQYKIALEAAQGLSVADFEACFHLIEFTSADDYKKSQNGWKPGSKKREMKLLDLKYLLIKNDRDAVEGFMSFMPTYEDDYPVIYCYEIHLSSALQGTGLGTTLMQLLRTCAARIPGTEKLMLTCFTSNQRGIKFYEKMGFVKDEFSPPPKVLRNGTQIESEYIILSKAVSSMHKDNT